METCYEKDWEQTWKSHAFPPSGAIAKTPGYQPIGSQTAENKKENAHPAEVVCPFKHSNSNCQKRNDRGNFANADDDAIYTWDLRKLRLIYEILVHNPDVITMQECDVYYEWYCPVRDNSEL